MVLEEVLPLFRLVGRLHPIRPAIVASRTYV